MKYLFLLLILPLAARAEEDAPIEAPEEPAAEAPAAPAPAPVNRFRQRRQADKPAAPAAVSGGGGVDMDAGQAMGGSGISTGGRTKETTNASPGSGGGMPSSIPGEAGALLGADGKMKLLAYPSYRAAPKWTGNNSHIRANFNMGPGTTYAIGFTAVPRASWSWVEGSGEGSDGCSYKAWLSETPGGAPVAGKACAPQTTGWTGGNFPFATRSLNPVEANWTCPLQKGRKYFFNLQLTQWTPNPNAGGIYSCIELLLPQGDDAILKE